MIQRWSKGDASHFVWVTGNGSAIDHNRGEQEVEEGR